MMKIFKRLRYLEGQMSNLIQKAACLENKHTWEACLQYDFKSAFVRCKHCGKVREEMP